MRLCLIIFAGLLAGCGQPPKPVQIPDELMQPEPGWRGPVPTTEGQLIDAAFAEKTGRVRANEKLGTIREIVVGPPTKPIRCNFFNCGI
jgi:hypothetical protein